MVHGPFSALQHNRAVHSSTKPPTWSLDRAVHPAQSHLFGPWTRPCSPAQRHPLGPRTWPCNQHKAAHSVPGPGCALQHKATNSVPGPGRAPQHNATIRSPDQAVHPSTTPPSPGTVVACDSVWTPARQAAEPRSLCGRVARHGCSLVWRRESPQGRNGFGVLAVAAFCSTPLASAPAQAAPAACGSLRRPGGGSTLGRRRSQLT